MNAPLSPTLLTSALRAADSPRRPRPHQSAALGALSAELMLADRATAVMACGTGKTLVGLWLAEAMAEQIGARRTLVLVPSLALMRQTMLEWQAHTAWNEGTGAEGSNRMLTCSVCSDTSISAGGPAAAGAKPRGRKASAVEQEDDISVAHLGFPATTDPEEVRRFLARPLFAGDHQVIFATYQSAEVVGQALRLLNEALEKEDAIAFDLAIFDEAHKTVGPADGLFSYALYDANLHIRKRTFFTATPKHYKVAKRDANGDFPFTSMDDENLYGRKAFKLSFAQAAEQKLIVPYKVIISVIDSARVDSEMLARGAVIADGPEGGRIVDAKLVAAQIALQNAIMRYKTSHVITFHSTVAAAQEFSRQFGHQGLNHGVETFHVSGKQPTLERETQMQAFAEAPRAVISNARCLTEGVDVPAVAMVAILDPRYSEIDVAQIIGRAMRLAMGKKFGYVMVPLLLDLAQGETLDQAVARSGFQGVIQTINAMREMDEMLEVRIREAKPGGRWMDGLVEVIGDDRGGRHGSSGELLDLHLLKQAVGTRLAESLQSRFDQRVIELREFKRVNGHANVPSTQPGLQTWLIRMRNERRRGRLSADRIARLDEIGVVWNPYADHTTFDKRVDELLAFKQKHGHANVLSSQPGLGVWLNLMRKKRRQGKLSADQIARLDEIGVNPHGSHRNFDQWTEELRSFKEEHGHANVPTSQPGLGPWLSCMRMARRQGKLSADQIARLDELEVVWTLKGARKTFDQWAEELRAFKQKHGHAKVFSKKPGLGLWITRIRDAKRRGELSAAQVARLDEIGLVWDPPLGAWIRSIESISPAPSVRELPDETDTDRPR
ncbi:Helicase associated domain protein [Pelomonas sp. APW6]|uniref:Helicase associated domain protein n=1 Tax=Roseateles subflavus TaxID=3053353 RepID=A0ABT7LNJ0_9BURK|nr:DEAD/DEAH box helicase [Pelomonas sp. APW6]MDL5034415.1 Helicase associated domain protein [Pelomonas sp. APW6]